MTSAEQIWALTDAHGCVIERINTRGDHPNNVRGAVLHNVMRCHAIADDFADDLRFDRHTHRWVFDARIMAIKRHNAVLAMLADPVTGIRIGLGLVSDEDKAAMIAALTEASQIDVLATNNMATDDSEIDL